MVTIKDNLEYIRSFIITSIIEQEKVLKGSVTRNDVNLIYERLTPHIMNLIQREEILITDMDSLKRRNLTKAFYSHNYKLIAQIIEKHILTEEQLQTGEPTFVLQQDSRSVQTTNPIWFLSRSGELSKYPPKHLRFVLKSRFSERVDSVKKSNVIYRALLKKLMGDDKPLSHDDVQEVLKAHLPELYTGLIEGESDEVERLISHAFNVDAHEFAIAYDIWKNSMKTREDSPRSLRALIEEEASLKQAAAAAITKDAVVQEIKARSSIPKQLSKIEQRYISTALFASEYDNLCKTQMSPRCNVQELKLKTKDARGQEITDRIRGILQEKMVYVPLSRTTPVIMEKFGVKPQEAQKIVQKTFDLMNDFIDTNSFQRAIVRSTELGDADFHSENVALVPMLEGEILAPITKLNPLQIQSFLQALKEISENRSADREIIEHLRASLIEDASKEKGKTPEQASKQVDKFFRVLVEVTRKEDLETALGCLAGIKEGTPRGLYFEIKIFDVDLTMPSSNETGVTGGIPPVRNILMALPKADDPLTSEVLEEIKQRRSVLPELVEAASQKFSKKTVAAYQERMNRLLKAAEESPMTPRGLVWRAIPSYPKAEAAFDKMSELDGDPVIPSEKHNTIGWLRRVNILFDTLSLYKIEFETPDKFPVNLI